MSENRITAAEFLLQLSKMGIKLWLEEGALRVRAPKGAMTPALAARIKKDKMALVEEMTPKYSDHVEDIPRLPRPEAVPLSSAQRRLWFLERLEKKGHAYSVPIALQLRGPIDPLCLQASFSEIVARHEILRTCFPMEGDHPVQQIMPAAPVVLNVHDLLEHPAQQGALIAAECRRPFELETGPLLRLHLIRTAPQSHVLLINLHHIVTDAWSSGILVHEIEALYNAHTLCTANPLKPLPIQYADYTLWQKQRMSGADLAKAHDFWRTKLGGAPPVLVLPYDRPRPAVQSFAGRTLQIPLTGPTIAEVKQSCHGQGLSPFMGLQTVFVALLAHYSNSNDIVLGTSVANRNHESLEALIGFFVNTVVLRTHFPADIRWRGLLDLVRQNTLEARAFEDFPFDHVVGLLKPERDLGYSPLFQVMFTYLEQGGNTIDLNGLKVNPVQMPVDTARFDLTLSLVETDAVLVGHWEYNTPFN